MLAVMHFITAETFERIELTDSVSEFGGGALMNCMSLREVILHAAPSAPTCLPRLLAASTPENSMCGLMSTRGLLFPEYVEELEDLSPAHIFQRRIHGAGYSYRQCFDGGALNFRQYDAALSELLERHDFSVAARGRAAACRTVCALGCRKSGVSYGFTHPRRQSSAVLRQGRRDRCIDLPAVARCALCRRCGCRVHVCPRSRADGSTVRSAVSRRQNAVKGTRQIV